MTKRTRLTILLICVACFFVVAPILVLYSMGYRFDFEKSEIKETGGIYVRTYPPADQIIVDSKIKKQPGLFSNSVFVQSLLPNYHTVLVEKADYYDYYKTIPVQEGQVTKIENILLIKKNIQFTAATDATKSPFNIQEKFVIKNNNLYYSNTAENSTLTAVQKTTPVIKKIVSFALQTNNIIWLGADGFLYKSDTADLTTDPAKITLTAIKINTAGSYKILTYNNDIFVIANGSLLFLDGKTSTLDSFYAPINDAKISPDGKNIIYYDNNSIYISPTSNDPLVKNVLYKSQDRISNCLWLNDSYIIFTSGPASSSQGGNKITISEIDYRGNINSVTLPQTITLSPDEKISLKNPQIFFNQQEGKLYILTGNTLLISEKIIP